MFKCNLGLERRLEDMVVRSEVATRLSRNISHFNIGQTVKRHSPDYT